MSQNATFRSQSYKFIVCVFLLHLAFFDDVFHTWCLYTCIVVDVNRSWCRCKQFSNSGGCNSTDVFQFWFSNSVLDSINVTNKERV